MSVNVTPLPVDLGTLSREQLEAHVCYLFGVVDSMATTDRTMYRQMHAIGGLSEDQQAALNHWLRRLAALMEQAENDVAQLAEPTRMH